MAMDSFRPAVFASPPSFHIDRLRKAPIGYFFDVDTNGFGVMPDYAAQVHAARSLVHRGLYPRAATESECNCRPTFPTGQKVPSPAPQFRDIGTGATLPEVARPPAAEGEPQMTTATMK